MLTCAPLFATLLVAAAHRIQERERRKLLSLFPPLLSRSSAETAAAETNDELVQQVVMGSSARCSCVSCYSSCSLGCPIGCSARFCSAACFATHQASCPFVTFAKPVMITFHESLKGASIEWAVAQQGGALQLSPGYVSEVVFCDRLLYSGSLHPLARSSTVEFWASLRPWFEYFQHGSPSARRRPRPLWAGIELPTGVVVWLFLARSSSKAWQVLGFTRASEGSEVE